jgi:putative heme degradation protein
MHAAACVFVVLMIKTGMSRSLQNYQKQGEAVIKNYYARNLDRQLFDEIFPEGPSSLA